MTNNRNQNSIFGKATKALLFVMLFVFSFAMFLAIDTPILSDNQTAQVAEATAGAATYTISSDNKIVPTYRGIGTAGYYSLDELWTDGDPYELWSKNIQAASSPVQTNQFICDSSDGAGIKFVSENTTSGYDYAAANNYITAEIAAPSKVTITRIDLKITKNGLLAQTGGNNSSNGQPHYVETYFYIGNQEVGHSYISKDGKNSGKQYNESDLTAAYTTTVNSGSSVSLKMTAHFNTHEADGWLWKAPNQVTNYSQVKNISIKVLGYYTGFSGSGTQADPYLLTCREDFDGMALSINSGYYTDKYFKVQPNASISGQSDGKTINMQNTAFTPIGNDATYKFAGHFDGNGCTINNLKVSAGNFAGLFGRVNGATIDNVTINGTVSGANYVGGVVGYGEGNAVVSRCTNNATVTGTCEVGGIAGGMGSGQIKNCYNGGNITATGSHTNSTYNSSAGAYVGGIVGSSSATVKYCYNAGAVTDNGGAGFAAGIVAAYANAVEYCYNIGTVTSTNGLGLGVVAGHGTTARDLKTCWAFYKVIESSTGADLTIDGGGNFINNNICSVSSGVFIRGRLAVISGDNVSVANNILPGNGASGWTDICNKNIEEFTLEIVVTENMKAQAASIVKNGDTSHAQMSTASVPQSSSASSVEVGGTITASITFGAGANASLAGYGIALVQLTVDHKDVSKVYGQSYSVNDWVTDTTGQTTELHYYNSSFQPTTITSPISVGTYYIGIDFRTSGALTGKLVPKSGNSNNLTLTVTKRSLDFTANQVTVFQTTAFNGGSFTLTPNTASGNTGILSDHHITYATATVSGYSSPNTGNFDVAFSNIKIMSDGTDVSSNYDYPNPKTFSGYFHVIQGDFGRNSAAKWGTQSNPYLIENAEQLQRLSQIVNGVVSPVNSVAGINGISSSDVQATGISYAGAYFTVVNNITAPSITRTDITGISGYSSNYAGTGEAEAIGKLFDRNNSSKYCTSSGANELEIKFQYANAVQVTGYYFVTGNDTNTIPGRNPAYIKLYGSNDNSNWTELDNRTNNGWTTANNTRVDFDNNKTTGNYRYYKLLTKANGDNLFQLSEFGITSKSFSPIGNSGKPFQGIFDGNSKTISGLAFSNDTYASSYIGLFGYVEGNSVSDMAVIKNLTVSGSVSGANNVGGIVGYAKLAEINNCTNNATISGASYVGGVVGQATGSGGGGENRCKLVTLKNTGSVTGSGNYVGGIAGLAQDNYWSGAFVNGASGTSAIITGKDNTGGIAGKMYGKNGDDNLSFVNYMQVKGTTLVGGILGWLEYGGVKVATNNGAVTGTGDYVGGLVGQIKTSGSFSGTIANNGAVSGASYVGGIVGGSLIALTIASGTNSAKITASGNYVGGLVGGSNSNITFTGTCTNSNVVQGATTSNYVGGIIGASDTQITISGATLTNTATVYGGNYVGGIAGLFNNNGQAQTARVNNNLSSNNKINGNGEGICCNGYAAGGIFGLTKGGGTFTFGNGSSSDAEIDPYETNTSLSRSGGVGWCIGHAVGFNKDVNLNFANLSSAFTGSTINMRAKASANTTIEGITLSSGGAYLGGLVGYNGSGNITGNASINLRTGGSLFAVNSGNYVGGIVGYNASGNITNCNNSGNVSSANFIPTAYAGGIVGYNASGTISYCNNSGAVNGIKDTLGTTQIGGIAGYSVGNITNCKNTANVSGTNEVGGIVGAIHSQDVAGKKIGNCYNSGNVSATAGTVGGIIGDITSQWTIEYCYNKGKVNGGTNTNYKIGGIIGWISASSSTHAQYCYNEGQICVNDSLNNSAVNAYVGEIIGYRAETCLATVSYCYAFFKNIDDATLASYNHNIGKTSFRNISGGYGNFVIVSNCTNSDVTPIFNNANTTWENIVSNNITSFKYFATTETIAVNNYLSIYDFDTQVYVSPKSMNAGGGAGSAVSVRDLVFDASIAKNICISKKAINLKSITLTYTGSNQINYLNFYYNNPTAENARLNWWNGNPTDARVFFTKTSGDDVNAGTSKFQAYAEIKTPSSAGTQYTLGSTDTIAYSIAKANPQVLYGGAAYGVVPPTYPIEPVSRYSGYANISKYIGNDEDTAVLFEYPRVYNAPDIVYDETSAFATMKYTLAVWQGTTGEAFSTYSNPDALFSVSYGGTSIPKESDDPTAYNRWLAAGISTGHFVKFTANNANINDVTIYFSLILTDFDKLSADTASAAGFSGLNVDDPWGSATNPYVISSWFHMVRLMEIVNGNSNPINSIQNRGIYANVPQSASHIQQPACSSTTFENGHFLLIANGDSIETSFSGLDLTKYSNVAAWTPIGSDNSTHYFAGSFDGNGNAIKIDFDENSSHVGLFGYVRSNGSARSYLRNLVIAGTVNGNEYVGALAGEISGNVNVYDIKNYATVTAINYVGGIVGKVGDGANLGAGATSSYLENYGAISGTSYIGGIAGIIMSGAGILESGNTYVLGANAGFVNWEAEITATDNYVGGIFGAMTTVSGGTKFTRFQPKFARSSYSITQGNSYVGGLVGDVQYSETNGNLLYIINVANEDSGDDYFNQWSFAGHPNANGGDRYSEVIGNGNYVGGIAGKLGNGFHQLGNVFVNARVEGVSYVGGIAGQAENGKFENCFVTNPDDYRVKNDDTDYIVSATGDHVGGMIGNLAVSASVVNCIVQNFDLNKNNPDNYIGGLVGYTQGAGSNISGYAIYTKANVSYTDTLQSNTYGSYIIIDSSIARLMTVRELFVYAGLRPSVETGRFNASNQAGTNNTGAAKGNISIGANLPTASGTPNSNSKMQVVFYDTNKTERKATGVTFNASNNSANTELYLRLAIDDSNAGSFIIGIEIIDFEWNNVTTSKSEMISWQNAYLNTVLNNTRYALNLTGVSLATGSTTYDTLNNVYTTYCYKWNVAGGGNETVHTSRTFSLTRDKSIDGFLIANETDWDNFCSQAASITGNVKLLTDLTISNVSSGLGTNGAVTFEGNNHTLTIDNTSVATAGYSVFQGAKNTTFKDLTIAGSISSTGVQNIAAFVGSSAGSLTFDNCTNEVAITSDSYNVGGFVGLTGSAGTYTFNNSVNNAVIKAGGDISRGNGQTVEKTGYIAGLTNSTYYGIGGTGGFVGKSAFGADVLTFDGCRNAKKIDGKYNCAGLVGYLTGNASIYSCANTGDIMASEGENEESIDSNAGGLCGLIDGTNGGHANLYASYNSGEVVAGGNRAGGLIAADSYADSSSQVTKIFYCYNTGDVYCGSKNPREAYGFLEAWQQSDGCQVGGIAGTLVNSEVRFCYNTGKITASGVQTITMYTERYARAGGIVGFVPEKSGQIVKIWNSYNIGPIYVNCKNANSYTRLGYGGIVGEIDNNSMGCIDIQWTWCLENCCYVSSENKWNPASSAIGSTKDRGKGLDGTFNVSNISDLTARTNASGELELGKFKVTYEGVNYEYPIADWLGLFGQSLPSYASSYNVPDLFSLIRSHDDAGIVNSTIDSSTIIIPSAWVLIEGCLPQLAMFATDTRDGIAMTAQNAGTAKMPYVIKDGIDLMGVSALTSRGHTFENEYIEFANKQNNLEEVECTYINMPQGDKSEDWFKFANGSTLTSGKSFHLFVKGALFATKLNKSDSGAAYGDWLASNYAYSIANNTWESSKTISDNNFIPIGHTQTHTVVVDGNSHTFSTVFKGHLSGNLVNANGEITGKAEVRGLNMADGKLTSFAYGFIGYLGDGGSAENFMVSGNISARTTGSNAIYVGIIGQMSKNTTVDGVIAGSSSKALKATSYGESNSTTYTGGIVGYINAESGRITIANCEIRNAIVTGYNGGTGGIIGAVAGGAAASISIANCAVTGAVITSNAGVYLGGIVGKRVTMGNNEYGNLAIDDCYVGTKNNTTTISAESGAKVIIKGQNTIGGIIANAQTNGNGSLTITNCSVFGDVYISRTESPANNTDNTILGGQLGTAIGGIAGFTNGESDSPILMRGALDFYGLINVNVSSSANIENIGGLIGYMGPYTIISSGAYTVPTVVNAYGKIDGGSLTVRNVGGVAGISNGGALDGAYTLGINISTPQAINLGGFIGYNIGDTSIARTGSVDSIEKGSIVGLYNVGGFIGNNGWNDANGNNIVDSNESLDGAIVNIGASSINGALYGTDSNKLSINLYSSVDGKLHVGGFIGVNASTVNGQFVDAENYGKIGAGDNSKGVLSGGYYTYTNAFGGIIGANVTGSHFNLTADASFVNKTSGQVGFGSASGNSNNTAYQQYVGGIIGSSMGELGIDPSATLSNQGAVFGYAYVGGAIGALVRTEQGHDMNGKMSNAGTVKGVEFVGGIIGIVMQDATIGAGEYTNTGSVTSSADINYSFTGGVIGGMYGIIAGTTRGASEHTANDGMANFINQGSVSAKFYAGGAIGLVDGKIDNARFENSASLTFTGGDSVGGVIGLITSGGAAGDQYPKDGNNQPMYNTTKNITTSVTNTYFGYISSSGVANLSAGASSHATTGNDSTAGGVGGVIGTIDASEITSASQWSGNSFFVNGSVTAESADGVGGVVGQIVRVSSSAPYITISNMLAHGNTVKGRNYVGGIVGFNGSANTNSGATASIANCYNIRGDVSGNNRGGIVGGYYGQENNNTDSPKTYSSYWVYQLPNSALLNINPKDLGKTLTATWKQEISAENYMNNIDVPSGYETWDDYIADFNKDKSDDQKLIQNASGAWGNYSNDNATPYSTGVEGDYTGYFFVYSSADNCPVTNGIVTTHSYSGNSSYADIDYWKMIAQTADAPDFAQSDIVSASAGNYDSMVETQHIYATAKVSINPANNKYYYLSITADNIEGLIEYTFDNEGNHTFDNEGNPTIDENGGKIFISVDTTKAQNVVVYYQPIYMGNSIEYDGVEHEAPIKGLTKKAKGATDAIAVSGVYFQFEGTTGERTLANNAKGIFNAGTDAATYDVDAYVWGISSDGYIVNLGRVYSRTSSGGAISTYQWTIRAKTLEVRPTWTTGVSNGGSVAYNTEHQGLNTLTIEGVYARDINTENGLLNVTLSDSAYGTSTPMTNTLTSGSNIPVIYSFGGAIDANKKNGNYSSITYTVTCKSNNGNYVINNSSNIITYTWTIQKYNFTCAVTADCESSSVIYDGNVHSINVYFNGGTSTTQTYKKDTLNIKAGSGSGISPTSGCNIGTYSFTPKNVDITGIVEAKRNGQDVSYNYNFTNGSTQSEVSFEIKPATVTVAWESGSSYVYNGDKQGPGIASVKLTYGNQSNVARTASFNADQTSFTIKGANSNETLTFTLANYKQVNAQSYTASVAYSSISGTNESGSTILGNYQLSAPQKTYSITQATISIDWESGDSFVYNGEQQGPGIASVKMTYGTSSDVAFTPTFNGNTSFTIKGANSKETLTFTLTNYKQVNANDYTASVAYSSISGSNAAGTTKKDNYKVNVSTKAYTISPATVTIVWESGNLYVYNGGQQGPGIASVTLDYGTQTGVSVSPSFDGNTSFTIVGAKSTETLTFTLKNYKMTNVGTYSIEATYSSISGSNAAGSSVQGNYDVNIAEKSYTIDHATITVTWGTASSYVYDGNFKCPDVTVVITYGDGQTKTYENPTVTNGHITVKGAVDSEELTFALANYNAVNVGAYNTSISYDSIDGENAEGKSLKDNYTIGETSPKSYSITPAIINVVWGTTTAFVYNGELQGIGITGVTMTYGTLTDQAVTTKFNGIESFEMSGAYEAERITFTLTDYMNANVGTYTPAISASITGSNAGGDTVSANYTINGLTPAQYTISAATVTLTWGTTTSFVYTGSAQGPTITNVQITCGTPASTQSRTFTISGNSLTIKGAKDTETLTFGLSHYTEINAGNYTAEVTGWNITGTNAIGDTDAKNYNVSISSAVEYTIAKSIVTWTYSGNTNKIYDGTSNAVGLSTSAVTFTSTNGGAKNPSISTFTGSYKSGSQLVSAVGNDYSVELTISLTSASSNNYQLQSASLTKTGNITRRGIDIVLNASNKIYKAYDNSDLLASLTSNTSNVSTSVRSNNYRTGRGFSAKNFASSDVEITFTISEETAGRSELNSSINGIKKTAVSDGGTTTYVYSAPDSSSKADYLKKATFAIKQDAEGSNYFINSIVTTGGTEVYRASGEATTVDILDNNSSGVGGNVASEFDISITQYNAQASYSNTMQSYVNDDNTYNKNWLPVSGSLNVPKSMSSAGVVLNVVNKWMFADVTKMLWNEGNYYSPDFNYNKSDDDTLDNAKSIKKYTQFNGNGNATYANNSTTYLLGAYLTSTNGYSHLNLKLRNQPTVVVGYFVNRNGYEISSLAGLLLATEYYKGNVTEDTDPTTVSITVVPEEFANYPYDPDEQNPASVPATYPTYNGADGTQSTPSGTTWDEYVELYRNYIRAKYGNDAADSLVISTYEYKNSNGEYVESSDEKWNYTYETESDASLNKYMDFVQVNNISGIFTSDDLAILAGEFGNDWGVGSTYLTNVLYTPVAGNVVTFVDSIFGGTFSGSYNGNGYTIDHFNVIVNLAEAGDANIGMFAHVQPNAEKGGKGAVYGIHLRNANVQVFDTNATNTNGTINVGGIVGLNQSTTAITNSSFHGTIIVNTSDADAVVNVGGIVGLDLSSVESYNVSVDGVDTETTANVFGTISIANVFVNAINGKVNAGGIIGGTLSGHTFANVVSMSEIYATSTQSTVGGLVGRVLGDTTAQTNDGVVTVTYAHGSNDNYSSMIESSGSQNSAYLANGVYTIANGVYTAVNKAIGNNTADSMAGSTYDALYAGSGSLYAVGSNNAYVGKLNSSDAVIAAKGAYDMLTDFALNAGSSDGIHESMRLADIIDLYVLLYQKNTVALTGANATTFGSTAYAKGTSWVAQGANGTTSSRLNVAYRQHLSLIRMFNYMNFTLNKDIRMAAEYDTHVNITKIATKLLDGEISITVAYVATPIKEAFFGNVGGSHSINMRYKNAESSVFMFESQDSSLTGKLTYDSDVAYEE